MEQAQEAGAGACRNCGAALPSGARFCPQCGQETHAPAFKESAREFVDHWLSPKGKLGRTLRLLVFKPGRLTREYVEGRRRQYVLPLRLYLAISFVFFVVARLLTSSDVDSLPDSPPPAHIEMPRATDCGKPGHAECTLVERWVQGRIEAARRNPAAFAQNLDAKALELAPNVMFVLLPLFAAIMMLTWRNRRMPYGQHLVFSLHLHSFWFLDLMAANLLLEPLSGVLQLVVPVYAVIAMRHVYGGRWSSVLARGVAGLLLYSVALVAALAVTLVIVISSLG